MRRPAGLGIALCLLYAGWALLYVHHTRVEVETGPAGETERVYTLWDDAMISMTYARNLARGEGLVWYPGAERVQGFTNLGVTLFMAVLHLAPVGPTRVSLLYQLAGIAMLLATLAGVHRLARHLMPGDAWAAAVATLVVALYAPLPFWTLQGADTGPTLLVTVAALVWVAERRALETGDWPRGVFGILALGVVIRPDATLLYLAFLAAAVATSRARAAVALYGAGLLALVWVALAGFGLAYYGDPLPNTYYLKATGSPRGLVLAEGLRQAGETLGGPGVALGALGIGGFVAFLRGNPLAWLVAATAAIPFAYNVWVGGDWAYHYHSRFAVPGMALYLVVFAAVVREGLRRVLGAERLASAPGRAALLVAALAGLGTFFPGEALSEWWLLRDHTAYAVENRQNARLGLYLREHSRPDTTVAVHWAGVIPYFSERPSIDVLGMSDRHIARLEVPRFVAGHSKWDWDYVVNRRRPDVIVRESRGLRELPAFRAQYVLARSPRQIQLAVRRDATARLTEPGVAFAPLAPLPPGRDPAGEGRSPAPLRTPPAHR